MSLKGYFLRHFYTYLKESYPFLTVIIIIDLLPLIAVFWLGWSAMDAIYLYFIETLILLAFTFAKMWKADYVLALLNQQTKELVGKIEQKENRFNLGVKLPRMRWAVSGIRGLLYSIFLVLNIPFLLLQMLIISLISGNGFSISGFLSYNVGKINLGFFSLNLFYIILLLLFLEHYFTFKKKFVKGEEFKNTGLINEAFNFSMRIVLQQVILIGLLAMIVSLDAGKSTIIFLILIKTLMDIISFILNRIWGSLKGKIEGKSRLDKT